MPDSTGTVFYNYISGLNPRLHLPERVSVINPYRNAKVKDILLQFCNRYYRAGKERILIVGINPGRFGAGITGVPFTDPLVMEQQCGIKNDFQKKAELSSTYVYEVICAFGGVKKFYKNFLLSSVCPLGFLKDDLNFNFYDSAALIESTSAFIRRSLKHHMKMGVSNKVVISFGEKNAAHLKKINDELHLFETILTTKHPRYIMQYKRKQKSAFIDEFLDTFDQALVMK